MPVTEVAIGLGSNLADPVEQLRAALSELRQLPATRLLCHSRFYRSAPMGEPDQPDYVNAAAMLETGLAAHDLLKRLQGIERRQGRRRERVRWGARTLDLDLLLWGETAIDEPGLTVPHPGLHLRPFVLYPLAEIAAARSVPGRGTVGELAAACGSKGLLGIVPGVHAHEAAP
jgi:2-amino-4-hydroxy-6-hydroxymethyldihydropteridine diphosphokinase